MNSQVKISEVLEKIHEADPRYAVDAYTFVLGALHYTMEKLARKGHVSARELLEGICGLAKEEYGRLARTVLEHWGVKTTDDFGNIVFNMIGQKLLGKTETDRIEDFHDVFDFKKVFEEEFKYGQ